MAPKRASAFQRRRAMVWSVVYILVFAAKEEEARSGPFAVVVLY